MANEFQVIVDDVKKVIAEIAAGLKWFVAELAKVVAWVDANVPAAQQAIATIIQSGDEAMTTLEAHAASGLGDLVANALDHAQTSLLNNLNASGLDLTTKKVLTADTVNTITAIHSITQAANTAALAKVLASTNAAATQVSGQSQAAN